MNIGSLLKNLLVVSALVVNCSAKVMQIKKHQMHVPSKLGEISLFHDEKGFFVKKDDKVTPIQNCDVPKELRNISNKKLKKLLGGEKSFKVVKITKEQAEKFLKKNETVMVKGKAAKKLGKKLSGQMASAYLVVKQFDNGEYKLELSPRLPGGGPVSASIAYWFVKSACYGTAVAAAGTAVVATGGAAGAVSGALVGGATLGAGAGATVAGAAITGAGTAAVQTATVATASAVSTGGVAGAVIAIEGAASGAAAWFMLLPLP